MALALFIAYALFLELPMFRFGGGEGFSDWQSCQIRAERYLFDLKKPDVVFVGSSMTRVVRTAHMGERFFNLGSPCIQISGGLELVEMKEPKPKVLVIEVNFLHDISESLVPKLIGQGPPLVLKKYLKPLRQEYSLPIVVKFLARYLRGHTSLQAEDVWFLPTRLDTTTGLQVRYGGTSILDASPDISQVKQETNPKYDSEWSDDTEQSCKPDCATILAKNLELIRQATVRLASAGTRVAFVEMPQFPKMGNSKLRTLTRQMVKREFPNNLYIRDESNSLSTDDGQHLAGLAALTFSRIIYDNLLPLMGDGDLEGREKNGETGIRTLDTR